MTAIAPIGRRRMPAKPTNPMVNRVATAATYSDSPFKLSGTSPSFIAFFCYLFVIITFRIPVGTETMVVALVALPMERTKLHIPSVAVWTFAMVGWSFLGYGKTDFPDVVIVFLTEFAKICLVVLAAVNVVTSKARLRMILAGMMLFFASYPLRGTILNYLTGVTAGDGRVAWNGSFANPNELAGMCVLQLGVALAVLAVERALWMRVAAIGCTFLLPIVIVLTGSRGAFIAMVVFLVVTFKRNWAVVKSKLWAIILLGILISYLGSDRIFTRLATIDDAVAGDPSAVADQGSAKQRLEIWRVARALIKEHWLTGVGIGAYGEAHSVMQERPGFSATAVGKRDTHSTYLNILAELGVVGFSFFGLIIYVTLKKAHAARKAAAGLSPALTAQLVWLEIALYGFLVAGIWGTYGRFMLLYIHVAMLWCAAAMLEEETATLTRAPVTRRMRGMGAPVAIAPAANASAR
jgi:O-antigen ligase